MHAWDDNNKQTQTKQLRFCLPSLSTRGERGGGKHVSRVFFSHPQMARVFLLNTLKKNLFCFSNRNESVDFVLRETGPCRT